MAIDPGTPDGQRARTRLAQAEARYRAGITRLEQGDDGAREAFAEAVAIAPMRDALYLELARACRARGLLPRAASLYRTVLALPSIAERERAAAASELAAIERDALVGLFVDGGQAVRAPQAAESAWARVPLGAVAGATVIAGLVLLLVVVRRRRGETLREIAAASPELQPAIAFLIGSLRHELLKHRLLVLADAIAALERGAAEPGHHAFVLARLFGGTPLVLAWAGHLGAFIRALGPRFDLSRTDPEFQRAKRALDRISRLAAPIHDARPQALGELAQQHRELQRFDAYLAGIQRTLLRQQIDDALLAEVRTDIAAELAGRPCAITWPRTIAPLEAELFRVDLVLLLRNLVRNAYQAALVGPAPAAVAVELGTTLEATGEEAVWITVYDSHPGTVPLHGARGAAYRGLDLVDRILARCDGTLEEVAGRDGYAKGLRVRLFGAAATDAGVAQEEAG